MSLPFYFAALPKEDIGPELVAKVTGYYADPRVISIIGAQRVSYSTYYNVGNTWTTTSRTGGINIGSGGEQGEQVIVHVNHARALARNVAARITNPKFIWEPQASTRSSKSSRAVVKARDVLEHYWHNCNHEELRALSVESAATMGEGFTHYTWDEWSGGEYERMEETSVYRGAVHAEDVLPLNVIRDPWRFPYSNGDWQIVRQRINKFEMAARVGRPRAGDAEGDAEARQKAVLESSTSITGWPAPFLMSAFGAAWSNNDIDVLRFYHRRTAVLPRGRDVTFLASGAVLDFRDLEWKRIPLIRRVEGELRGTPFGYPSFWEIVNLQQLYDTLQTAVATNQATFAGQLIGIKRGSGVNMMQLGSALSAIECDDEKAVWPIQLTKSPPEVFPHMESLLRHMERQMGASKISFGEAEGDRQSGTSQALLSAQLTENASGFQTSDVKAIKDGAELILNMVQVKATVPVEIARVSQSKAGAFGAKMEVRGEDLKDIDQVFINLGSPITQNTEGRVKALQVASTLNIPVTAEGFWQVLNTGRLEPVAESDVEQAILIQQENEQIITGVVPQVLLTDDHFRHGHQHTITMSDVTARGDEKAVAAYMAHMNEHYKLAYNWNAPDTIDPMTGMLIDGPRHDPMYNPRMQGLARGVPPPPPAPMALPPAGDVSEPAPAIEAPQMPGNPDAGVMPPLPSMPKNPATGEKFAPNTPPTAAGR